MAQYRYNLILDRWTILAADRGKRPTDFLHKKPPHKTPPPDFDPTCPFCPGNETHTPPETFALRHHDTTPDSPGWNVRVVPNKFPALAPHHAAHTQTPPLALLPGHGAHEVIIESPIHNRSLGHHPPQHAYHILHTLRQRYQTHAQNNAHRLITIFYNHGPSSGASLTHPHFQLLAQPLVPPFLKRLLLHHQDYHHKNNRSPFDAVIDAELRAQKRLILADQHVLALCPFASACPFEAYLLPRYPTPHIADLDDVTLASLANTLQNLLRRLDSGLDAPDYNITFHTAPLHQTAPAGFRCFLQIYPRLSTMGGFELASDTFINTIPPETAAHFYRQQSQT